MHKVNYRLAVSILGLAMMLQLSGQKLVNSPYSRFNLGMLEPTASFRSAGMGGISTSLRDRTSVSYANAASYSSIDTNSFVFDIGIDYSAAFLKSGTDQHFSDDFNFDHLLLAFPISKKWGMAAGIVPFSNGYYNIASPIVEGDPEFDPVAGPVTILNRGTGGFTRAFIGTGVEVIKNLSAGININVLFGEINRSNEYRYDDDLTLFSSRFEENLSINGLYFDGGLQYLIPMKNKQFLNLGLAYTLSTNFKSDYNNIFLRTVGVNLPPFSPDTLSVVDITNGRVTLPNTISAGVSYGINDKLTIGVDYSITSWDKASIYGAGGYLGGTQSIRGGIEFIPDKLSVYNYLDRVEYRLGGHVTDNYLVINGEQVKEFGISFGVGLPTKRSWSKLNLFFDYNSRGGSLSNGLHRENIYSFGLSLNFYDYWFLKAKYD